MKKRVPIQIPLNVKSWLSWRLIQNAAWSSISSRPEEFSVSYSLRVALVDRCSIRAIEDVRIFLRETL